MPSPNKVLIALPPIFLERIDKLAQHECRTRSDLFREALRQYLDNARQKGIDVDALPAAPPKKPDGRILQQVKIQEPTREELVRDETRKVLEASVAAKTSLRAPLLTS